MSRTAGLFDEPEEEVVVLTAVALGALAAQLLIQRPLEDRQMTASTSSWSARARYSPVASVSAALVLAAMPLFSTFLYTMR